MNNDDAIRQLLKQIEAMLREETVEVTWSRGVHRRPDAAGSWLVSEPSKGVTLEIKIHGGAQTTNELAWFERLRDENS